LVTALRTTHFKLPMQYRYHILLQAIAQQAIAQALGAWPLPAIFHQPFTLLWQWQAHYTHYTTANPFYSLSARAYTILTPSTAYCLWVHRLSRCLANQPIHMESSAPYIPHITWDSRAYPCHCRVWRNILLRQSEKCYNIAWASTAH